MDDLLINSTIREEFLTAEHVDNSRLEQVRFEFGVVLWKILFGGKNVKRKKLINEQNADLNEAAKRLGVSRLYLRDVLRGRVGISQKLIIEKRWREILFTNYEETWIQNKKDFDKTVALLSRRRAKRRRQIVEPTDRDSFGHVLWLILGGKNASRLVASSHLNISPSRLSAIIHGRVIPLRKALGRNDWRARLEEHYPITWIIYAPEFEKKASLLPMVKRQVCGVEERADFGRTLLLIIGGEDGKEEAANLLGLNVSVLSRMTEGKFAFSREWIRENRWCELLSEIYPDGWQKYHALFEEKEAKLPLRRIARSFEPEEGSFGRTVWSILGGDQISIKASAEILEIESSGLSKILHNQWKITAENVAGRKWRERFEEYFPDTWRENKPFFEERLNMGNRGRRKSPHATKAGQSTRDPEKRLELGGLKPT